MLWSFGLIILLVDIYYRIAYGNGEPSSSVPEIKPTRRSNRIIYPMNAKKTTERLPTLPHNPNETDVYFIDPAIAEALGDILLGQESASTVSLNWKNINGRSFQMLNNETAPAQLIEWESEGTEESTVSGSSVPLGFLSSPPPVTENLSLGTEGTESDPKDSFNLENVGGRSFQMSNNETAPSELAEWKGTEGSPVSGSSVPPGFLSSLPPVTENIATTTLVSSWETNIHGLELPDSKDKGTTEKHGSTPDSIITEKSTSESEVDVNEIVEYYD